MKRLALLLCLATTPAFGHSFYDPACCSDRDCWPAGKDDDAREPAPRVTPQGYVLHDGTVVPFTDARPSPDGRYHVCRLAGSLSGELIRTGRKACLYVPQGVF